MRTQCQRCTSCIVFTSGSSRPVPMRSKRKSCKPSSNLQATFWQTPSKYRGPHINDMRWKQPHQMTLSRLMAHKKLAKADPKVGSKIHRKNRSHHKGPPLCADKGADAWLASSFAGMRYLAPTKQIRLGMDTPGIRKCPHKAWPQVVKHVARSGPHFGVQKVDLKMGAL